MSNNQIQPNTTKKQPIIYYIEKLEVTLKDKVKLTYGDIISLGFPQSTLNRIKKSHVGEGRKFVKQGRYYMLPEQKKELSQDEYNRRLDHFKKLIPALTIFRDFSLEDILEIEMYRIYYRTYSKPFRKSNYGLDLEQGIIHGSTHHHMEPKAITINCSIDEYQAAVEHLKSYPDILKPLEKNLNGMLEEPDKCVKELKDFVYSESFRYFRDKDIKQLSKKDIYEFNQIMQKFLELRENTYKYRINNGFIKENEIRYVSSEINKLIVLINHSGLLDGECHLCKKM